MPGRRAHRSGARATDRGRPALEPARRPGAAPARPRPAAGRTGSTLVVRDPLGLRSRTVVSEELAELIVLPRVDPVAVGGRGPGGPGLVAGIEDGARARPDRRPRDRARGRRAARLPRGQPGLPDPLARRRPHGRAGRAQDGRRRRRARRWSSSTPRDRRATTTSTPPSALPARCAGTWRRRAAAAFCCPATAARPRSSRSFAAGPRFTRASPWSSPSPPRPRSRRRVASRRSSGSPPAPTRRCRRRFAPVPAPRYLVGPSVGGRGMPALMVSGCEGRRHGARGAARPLGKVA